MHFLLVCDFRFLHENLTFYPAWTKFNQKKHICDIPEITTYWYTEWNAEIRGLKVNLFVDWKNLRLSYELIQYNILAAELAGMMSEPDGLTSLPGSKGHTGQSIGPKSLCNYLTDALDEFGVGDFNLGVATPNKMSSHVKSKEAAASLEVESRGTRVSFIIGDDEDQCQDIEAPIGSDFLEGRFGDHRAFSLDLKSSLRKNCSQSDLVHSDSAQELRVVSCTWWPLCFRALLCSWKRQFTELLW